MRISPSPVSTTWQDEGTLPQNQRLPQILKGSIRCFQSFFIR